MKRIFLLSLLFSVFSCTTDINNCSGVNDDLELIGRLHNEGLMHVYAALCQLKTKSDIDFNDNTDAMIEQIVKDYCDNNSIQFCKDALPVSMDSLNFSECHMKYLDMLLEIVRTTPYYLLNEKVIALENLINEEEDLKNDERFSIKSACVVARWSVAYWSRHLQEWQCLMLNEPTNTKSDDRRVEIRGRVKDDYGDPIIGVSVRVLGTNTGTITDIDGKFSIKTMVGNSLEISFVGLEHIYIYVDGNHNDYDITMRERNEESILSFVIVGSDVLAAAVAAIGTSGIAAIAAQALLASAAGAIGGLI